VPFRVVQKTQPNYLKNMIKYSYQMIVDSGWRARRHQIWSTNHIWCNSSNNMKIP
jgi:hypothetical protein